MTSLLHPKHLSRYRDITRLLLKYGRGDLLRESGIEEFGRSDVSSMGSVDPVVHERSGEILQRQRVAERSRENGVHPSSPAAPAEAADRSAELASDLEAMGVTFVKVGQFLSTRADLLPASYLEALTRLQDRVDPFPFAEVESIVSRELGVRLSKAFSSFEEVPLAAASIGQVHRAELRSGRAVAVKVQRPGIQERIVQDLELFAELANLLGKTATGQRYDFASIVEEFRKSLLRELDYRQEARHLRILSENLAGFDRIVVPRPFDDYVTPRLLTMELIQGRNVTALGPLAKVEMDGAPLAEELCHAYLRQILVDGFFHADPHPGNIFLTDDGRIAILDLGMVGQVSHTMQEDLLKLVIAISEGRGEDAGDVIVKIGTPLNDADPVAARRRVAELVMHFQGLRLREIALGRLLFDAARAAAECGYRMPREMTLLGKTLLNVDQVARTLDPDFDPNASIRRHAAEITHQRMLKNVSPGRLFAGMLELNEFAEKLPRRLNQLIDAITENRVRLNVDALDEVLLMEGLQKIANRITLGLVISGMIVGAALLMRIETSFRILGYPGLAILFFLAAAIGGLVLVVNIFLYDLRAAKEKLHGTRKS